MDGSQDRCTEQITQLVIHLLQQLCQGQTMGIVIPSMREQCDMEELMDSSEAAGGIFHGSSGDGAVGIKRLDLINNGRILSQIIAVAGVVLELKNGNDT